MANAGKPGDADGDGEITVTDALLTLQGSVGKITLSPEAQGRADVDGDGKSPLPTRCSYCKELS